MGIYTVLEDNRVDDVVEKDLKRIVERVTAVKTVRSIILGGGFGRGEGSVLVNDAGIKPVNDYDVFIIVSDEDKTDFRQMSKELAKEISIRLLDLIPLKHSDLPTLPATQFNYDLRYGGRHLWGEKALDLIPCYKEGHVVIEAGRTLLLNRLICAIEAYSERFDKNGMLPEEEFFLVNQTGKVVSACVEALLIKKQMYHHSYRRRMEIFEAEFPEKNVLKQLNKKATEFKLRPSLNHDFDAVVYWKEAVHEYITVFSEYFVPDQALPVKGLWRSLKKDAGLTNTQVERVELMLLLYREAAFFGKMAILSEARRELGVITKTSFNGQRWEALRARTARLWHELYH